MSEDTKKEDEEFEGRPEDTVPLWMIDDVELGLQLIKDQEDRRREGFFDDEEDGPDVVA